MTALTCDRVGSFPGRTVDLERKLPIALGGEVPVLTFSDTLIRYYKALDKLRAYDTVHSDTLATQLTSRAHVCMCFRSDEATLLSFM